MCIPQASRIYANAEALFADKRKHKTLIIAS